jgi:elongation factor Ts
MNVSIDHIKELREKSGAGIMDCRGALIETNGDLAKAAELLREKNLVRVEKKSTRTADQGIVETYIHTGGRIGAMVELNCETDFVARTPEFRELAHNLAMQVAAQEPLCIDESQVPDDPDCDPEIACLLLQPFIKDPEFKIRDLVTEAAAKLRENIRVRRFARFELGQAEAGIAEIVVDVVAGTDA